ncbi:peptidyl-tRNA hydrolase II domain-containing protein [Halteromyces radiatus]|uniref:peptidyl-tRNA hydrolase II domain-containing protein n=1 Tax=Halteromyces radiatus TaxID=101107 RepID=UPI002221029C|nr:peptidyl-tRNA hydrolase II domain-containing protein [Halteromyces radiatus]KAI8088694.1 peptidyl-tRNA hydrolase II domain-containing protein [Halteromyces radiatus]
MATVAACEHLTMYIVVRKDLAKTLKWPTGSVMAQACHAATAVLHTTRNDSNTIKYVEDHERMHKVVLETKNEETLGDLVASLQAHNIPLYRWVEQPENIPTAMATAPIPERSPEVKDLFKKYCSLYR